MQKQFDIKKHNIPICDGCGSKLRSKREKELEQCEKCFAKELAERNG